MRLTAIFLLIISATTLSACNGKKTVRLYDIFGTEIVVDISGKKLNDTVKKITDLFSELDNRFDPEKEGGDLYNVNRAAADEVVTVSAETYSLLKLSKEMYEKTDGYFNIATYGLSALWKFDSKSYTAFSSDYVLPTEAEIKETIAHTDLDNLVLMENCQVKKLDAGLKIGFGAIAKGYAGDRAYEASVFNDGQTGILNVGGTIFTVGNRDFAIGIGNPRDSEADYFAKLSLKGNDVVCTSGDYFRYYTVNGKRYCHIFGKDGYPVDNNIISVTVVSENGAATGAMCDVLSTAVFALGKKEGAILAKQYNVGLVIIYDDKTFDVIGLSDGVFTLKDGGYKQNV